MCETGCGLTALKSFRNTRTQNAGNKHTHSHTPVRRRRELRGTLQRGALVCSAWRLAMTDVSTVHVTYKARCSGVAACMDEWSRSGMVRCGHRPPAPLETTPGPATKACDDLTLGRGTRLPRPARVGTGAHAEGGTRGELGVGCDGFGASRGAGRGANRGGRAQARSARKTCLSWSGCWTCRSSAAG